MHEEDQKVTAYELAGIGQLLRKYRHHPVFGKLAPLLTTRMPLDERTFQQLLGRLEGPLEIRSKQKTLAVWALGRAELSAEQQTQAVQSLCDLITGRKINRWTSLLLRAGKILLNPYLFGIVLLVLLSSHWRHGDDDDFREIFFCLLCGSVCYISYSFRAAMEIERRGILRGTAAIALGRIGRTESIDVLARASHELYIGDSGKAALYAILPSLTVEHFGQIEARTVLRLIHLLEREAEALASTQWTQGVRRAADNAHRLLVALDKIGDGRAIPAVQKVVDLETSYSELASLAKTVLPTLVARKQQQNAREMLLRAAEPEHNSTTLLRAAQATDATFDSNQLVRPVEGELYARKSDY